MARQFGYYDILDVLPGASADDVRQSYEAKAGVLAPELIAGAPSKVVTAAGRAQVALQAAVRVLTDPDSRRRYDNETGIRPTGGGLAGPANVPSQGIWAWDPSWNRVGFAGPGPAAITDALGVVADWLAPHPARPRHVTVPDARGLFVGPARRLISASDLHAELVQLTQNPLPVEGLVVDQSPRAGTIVHRSSTVVAQVWHPSRRDGRPA